MLENQNDPRLPSIPKLTGSASSLTSNFFAYKFRILRHLAAKGLRDVVDGNDFPPAKSETDSEETPSDEEGFTARDPEGQVVKEWKERDRRAMDIIALTVGDDQIGHIQACSTAREAWRALSKVHEGAGQVGRTILRKRLCTMTLEEGGSVQAHLDAYRTIADQMKNLGQELDDSELVSWLLISLPESYEHFGQALQATSFELTFDHASIKLLQEEARRQARGLVQGDEGTALAAVQQNASGSAKRLAVKERKPGKCFNCGKQGHWRRECRKPKQSETDSVQDKSSSEGDQVPLAFTGLSHAILLGSEATTPDSNLAEIWNVDSGSTFHITSQQAWLSNRTPIEPVVITLGDGRTVTAMEKGMIYWKWSKQEPEIVINDVLYIPSFAANLLSVGKLSSRGIDTVFTGNGFHLIKDGRIVLTGQKGKFGYFLGGYARAHVQHQTRTAFFGTQHRGASWVDWHRRLGHLSYKYMHEMLQHKLADGFNIQHLNDYPSRSKLESFPSCGICPIAKAHRLPFPSSTTSRAEDEKQTTGLLDLVHMDICGPITPATKGGARYFLPITEDSSRRRDTFLLKTKGSAEVLEHFKVYKRKVELATGRRIRKIRTDGGMEFNSQLFKDFLTSEGIQHEVTNPYTPQQNSISERFNRTIMDTVRSMLFDVLAQSLPKGNQLLPPTSELPDWLKQLWGEAVVTATYIRNRTITSVHGKTPYEAWEGYSPDISYFQPFGTPAAVLIPKQQRPHGKLNAHTETCILVGYGHPFGRKGYRFFSPDTGRGIFSRDVTFMPHQSVPGIPSLADLQSPQVVTVPEAITTELGNNSKTETGNIGSQEQEVSNKEEQQYRANHSDEGPAQQLLSEIQQREPQAEDNKSSQVTHASRSTLLAGIDPSNIIEKRTRGQKQSLQSNEMPGSFVALGTANEPTALADIKSLPEGSNERRKWEAAIATELKSLKDLEAWEEVDRLPTGLHPISSKWVFKVKSDRRYKARLVARGFTQQYGLDYTETFAPVAKFASFRFLLATAVLQNLSVIQLDIPTAYLNGKLSDEDSQRLFLELPDGTLVRLQRALYGLKQSARVWYKEIDGFFESEGFTCSALDHGVYYNSNKRVWVLLYVDDLLVFGEKDSTAGNALIESLVKTFNAKVMGPIKTFLGIQIEQNNDATIINQQQYIKAALRRFGMEDSRPVSTPMDAGLKLQPTAHLVEIRDNHNKTNAREYQAAIGTLMYASLATRPDITFAVNIVSQFASDPSDCHWAAVKRIFRYLRGTRSKGIAYQKPRAGIRSDLHGFTDADWGSNFDRKSIGAYAFLLAGGVVSWSSKKQATIALSSTEAEYMGLTQAVKESLWLDRLQSEISPHSPTGSPPPTIFCDNQGAIALSKNPQDHGRTKHISIQYHFVREHSQNHAVDIRFIGTDRMVADVLTKALGRPKFIQHCEGMGLQDAKGM